MKYRSTRGEIGGLTFSEAVSSGLAEDGGLLLPEKFPVVDDTALTHWRSLCFEDLCFQIMRIFIDQDEIPDEDMRVLIKESFSSFRIPEVVAVNTGPSPFYLLELFHGPTFAFKDVALQFLGKLFDYLEQKSNKNQAKSSKLVVLGATSGDTGSAAIAGIRGSNNVDCVILFPKGRTSEIQELQMTTVPDSNVHCVAIEGGTFDDCQALVKSIFNSPLKKQLNLRAVNSINWARILAQMTYFTYASFRILDILKIEGTSSKVDFSVPTGNFGNILSAFYARKIGAPIGDLIISSNSNDILTRLHSTGSYKLEPVDPTISPSMDIQVSSNFERFMYELCSNDSDTVRSAFQQLSQQGKFDLDTDLQGHFKSVISSSSYAQVSPERKRTCQYHIRISRFYYTKDADFNEFYAFSANEEETKKLIKEVYYSDQAMILDPHTAVGVVCARKFLNLPRKATGVACVCVATAHFGKFYESLKKLLPQDAVEDRIPEQLKSLFGLPKRFDVLTNDLESFKRYLADKFSRIPGEAS